MSVRTIKLLHVEDDVIQQRLTAQQLKGLPEFTFAITTADSEDGAVASFARLQPELVLLDYHLSQGNGLSCLRKLREQDRFVRSWPSPVRRRPRSRPSCSRSGRTITSASRT
jgi:CheY-like chemotaxis protein